MGNQENYVQTAVVCDAKSAILSCLDILAALLYIYFSPKTN